MKQVLFSLAVVITFVLAQQQGSQKQEYHPQLTLQTCTKSGGCTSQNKKAVMDSNWRWTHKTSGYSNCYTGNTWDSSACPDPVSCAQNCALDGVDQNDMKGTYGIDSDGNTLTLRFVTHGAYSTNIGSRMYLLDDDDSYYMFKLLNREFTFDVDVSNLPCGLNGALYFSEMQKDGGKSYSGNKCGARYGTGYCDAQCPHDIKFINGEANVKDWKPSPSDPNSGVGHYGSCCPEMDIWEGNSASNAYTVHGCKVESQSRCEGTDCGDNDKGERFKGVCDKDGCDFNPFRQGDHSFYGSGSNFKIDTTKPFTVVTQFITTDGTDNGQLKEVRRLYVQNGQVIANTKTSISGMQAYDSITDDYCNSQKSTFGDVNDFKVKGGMKKMGEALGRGMVLVMSLWDDHEANMLWLDSNYPLTKDPSQPGVARGSCSTSSGVPADVESQYPNSSVKYGNIKVGEIDSTYNGGSSCPGGSLSACISLCPSESSAYKVCVQECMKRCNSNEKSEIFLG